MMSSKQATVPPSQEKVAQSITANSIHNNYTVQGVITQALSDYAEVTASQITVSLQPVLIQIARHLGRLRQMGHEGRRKPHEDFGRVRNQEVDFYGVLGELVFILAMERIGLQPSDYQLVANFAPPGADVRIGDRRFQLKTIPPSKRFVTCNEESRLQRINPPTHLLPMQLIELRQLRLFEPIPWDEVGTWRLMNRHSAYRSISVEELRPLLTWETLLTS